MSDRMQGRRVLITGGASGIGRATAMMLREAGASVAVVDRTADAAAQVAAACGGHAVTVPAGRACFGAATAVVPAAPAVRDRSWAPHGGPGRL